MVTIKERALQALRRQQLIRSWDIVSGQADVWAGPQRAGIPQIIGVDLAHGPDITVFVMGTVMQPYLRFGP